MTAQLDDPTLIPELEAAGVQFQGRIESHWLSTLLSWIVPALTFAAIWGLFMRRMSTASVLMTIGKSKAKVYVECEVHTPEGQTIVLEMSPAFLTRKVFQRCCSATRDEAYERQRHPNARVASWCSTSGTAPTVTARRVDDMARRGQANNGSGAGRARITGAHFSENRPTPGKRLAASSRSSRWPDRPAACARRRGCCPSAPPTVSQEGTHKGTGVQPGPPAVGPQGPPAHVAVARGRAEELAQRRGLPSAPAALWRSVGQQADPRWVGPPSEPHR